MLNVKCRGSSKQGMGSSKQGVEPHQIILGLLGGSAKLRIAPDLILPDTTFLDTTFLHRNTATPLNYEIGPPNPTLGKPPPHFLGKKKDSSEGNLIGS